MVNHSCVPNAYITFEKRKAFLKAERDIEPGDEILISYIGMANPNFRNKLSTSNSINQITQPLAAQGKSHFDSTTSSATVFAAKTT